MLELVIGVVIGAVMATTYNLVPIYENLIKPSLDACYQKLVDYSRTF